MLKYIIAIIFAVPLLLIMLPLMLIMCIKPDLFSYNFRYQYIRFIVRWVNFLLRVNHNVEGIENIPEKGNFLITPNHQSFYDILSLMVISKRPFTVVAKAETKKMFIINMIVRIFGSFFLERDNIRKSLQLMKDLEEFLKKNPNVGVVIFPEGTRTKDPDLKIDEFKGGTFKVAYKVQAPVIPCVMCGTPRILHLKWYWKHPVDIKFGKVLNYEDYKDMTTVDLANHCRSYSVENLDKILEYNDCRRKVKEN